MRINYLKNTAEIFDENEILISMKIARTVAIYPDLGKVIRNKKTGEISKGGIILSSSEKVEDYEEIAA